jgi:sodium-dependent dicarboxylate transporter 2/3/5
LYGAETLNAEFARRAGLIAGPLCFLAMLVCPAPAGLEQHAWITAATTVLMAVWWLTEAVPVTATAMVPLVVLPIAGVMDAASISAPYASKTNFLFLGGLIIATALARWDLHRRIALVIILRFGGTPSRLILGFMTATALMSAWISNSAVTMMMLPIAAAVLDHFERDSPDLVKSMGPVLLLAVAYSATIGGMATIIGTPPNAVFVGALAQLFPEAPPIGFLQWMLVGVPLATLMIPLAWAWLVFGASDVGRHQFSLDRGILREQLDALGTLSTPERRVLVVFVATALLWMFRRPIEIGAFLLPGWSMLLPQATTVGDSTVAIGMALMLFAIPAGDGKGSRLLDWETASKLPWGVIVLLGGGFALAAAIQGSGLAAWLGTLLSWAGSQPGLLGVLLLCLTVSFVTEVTTNTAITTILMPILAATAVAGQFDPLLLMVPCTLAASLCFMMPSGTAPNAIVFSDGRLSVATMARAGFPLNLFAVLLVTAVVWLLALPVFGISLGAPPPWI